MEKTVSIDEKKSFSEELRLLSRQSKIDRINEIQTEIFFNVVKKVFMDFMIKKAIVTGTTYVDITLSQFFDQHKEEIRNKCYSRVCKYLLEFPNPQELEWFGKKIHEFLIQEDFYVIYDKTSTLFTIGWDS